MQCHEDCSLSSSPCWRPIDHEKAILFRDNQRDCVGVNAILLLPWQAQPTQTVNLIVSLALIKAIFIRLEIYQVVRRGRDIDVIIFYID